MATHQPGHYYPGGPYRSGDTETPRGSKQRVPWAMLAGALARALAAVGMIIGFWRAASAPRPIIESLRLPGTPPGDIQPPGRALNGRPAAANGDAPRRPQQPPGYDDLHRAVSAWRGLGLLATGPTPAPSPMPGGGRACLAGPSTRPCSGTTRIKVISGVVLSLREPHAEALLPELARSL